MAYIRYRTPCVTAVGPFLNDAARGTGYHLLERAHNSHGFEGGVLKYPKYTTTVIGAHSVPDWFESLDRLLAVGQLSIGSMADAQFRASEAAVLDQELAGIDVVTGGEMHRRTHNRHSPPNAMLNYFWQKIPAFQGGTRSKPITKHDPDRVAPDRTFGANRARVSPADGIVS
jgi:hypothetical protein